MPAFISTGCPILSYHLDLLGSYWDFEKKKKNWPYHMLGWPWLIRQGFDEGHLSFCLKIKIEKTGWSDFHRTIGFFVEFYIHQILRDHLKWGAPIYEYLSVELGYCALSVNYLLLTISLIIKDLPIRKNRCDTNWV